MERARISESEWEVMRVVWDKAPVAAAEVAAELAATRGWALRTTRTLLGRLVTKGALVTEEDGKRYLYRPRLKLQDCVRQASRHFAERVFGGRPGAMLIHLVKQAEFSAQELAELKRILEEKGR